LLFKKHFILILLWWK